MQKSKRRADISTTVNGIDLLCSNDNFYQQFCLDSGDFPRELGDLEWVPSKIIIIPKHNLCYSTLPVECNFDCSIAVCSLKDPFAWKWNLCASVSVSKLLIPENRQTPGLLLEKPLETPAWLLATSPEADWALSDITSLRTWRARSQRVNIQLLLQSMEPSHLVHCKFIREFCSGSAMGKPPISYLVHMGGSARHGPVSVKSNVDSLFLP